MGYILYEKERHENFFKVCSGLLKEKGGYYPVRKLVEEALLLPADSYFVAPHYIKYIVKNYSEPSHDVHKQLYKDIRNEYARVRAMHPGLTNWQIYDIICTLPAPRFYLSVERGVAIYYKLLKTGGRSE